MKPNSWTIVGLLVVLLVGIVFGQQWDNRAMAQAPDPGNVLRYQISAYGCYIVDTRTGQVWHVLAGGGRQEVSAALP